MKLTGINTQQIGNLISKAGLVLVLLWIGIYKFTPTEAKLIEPLLVNSPLFLSAVIYFSARDVIKNNWCNRNNRGIIISIANLDSID